MAEEEIKVEEKDTDIVKRTLIDGTLDGAELDIRTPYVVREVQVTQRQRIPVYVNGKLKSAEELAELGLTVREYTRLEVEIAFYADLYERDAAGDGALQLRVRQYKGMLDTLGLAYDTPQDAIMTAIQSASITDAEKATLALTMKTVYDAITTNLEYLGSDCPHMDTYEKLPKLIRFLPEVPAQETPAAETTETEGGE